MCSDDFLRLLNGGGGREEGHHHDEQHHRKVVDILQELGNKNKSG